MTLSDLRRGAGAASSSSSPPLLPPSSGEEGLFKAVKCFDSQSVCSSTAGCGSSERIFFPAKLHDIVSAPSTNDIIRWLPSGKAFIIADKKRFAQEILPRCFSQQNTQFTSFTRKLSRWCFNRVPRGPLIGAYFHDLFIRDRRDLVSFLCSIQHLLPFSLFIVLDHDECSRNLLINLCNCIETVY